MQELLGRISELDPDACVTIRIIACFDELIAGQVGVRALLSTAAALGGCVAGAEVSGRCLRVDRSGEELSGPGTDASVVKEISPEIRVWLETERKDEQTAMILERVGLAVGIRHGIDRARLEPRRDLTTVVDASAPEAVREAAGTRLGLMAGLRYRVVVAPLFAVWDVHPRVNNDVVPTAHGLVHAVLLRQGAPVPTVSPAGIGMACAPHELPRSFATALVALRMCGDDLPTVTADDFGGLVQVIAEAPPDKSNPDVERTMRLIAEHSWAQTTLHALMSSSTVREAARVANVHHSTMQSRVDTLEQELGYHPLDGYGRIRIGIAYLACRLHGSRVLRLPTPAGAVPNKPIASPR